MPKKGYKSITVPEALHNRLMEIADKTHRSIPKLIEHMLEEVYSKPEGGAIA